MTTTHQPIDTITLTNLGVLVGYKNDTSTYTQKIPEPVWGVPLTSYNIIKNNYDGAIITRRSQSITDNLVYKNLCNNNGACLIENESGGLSSTTNFNTTNIKQLWALDQTSSGQILVNKNGKCVKIPNDSSSDSITLTTKSLGTPVVHDTDKTIRSIGSGKRLHATNDGVVTIQITNITDLAQQWVFRDNDPELVLKPPRFSQIYTQSSTTNNTGLTFISEGRKPWNQKYQFSCVDNNGNESTKSAVSDLISYGTYQMPKIRVGANPCGTNPNHKLKIYRGDGTNMTPLYSGSTYNFDNNALYNGKDDVFIDKSCPHYYNTNGSKLDKGQFLYPCEEISNGTTNLKYQADGNIAVRVGSELKWHPGVTNTNPGKLIFTADGYLQLVDKAGTQYWRS